MRNLSYYLGFSHCLGIGPMKFNLLLKEFESVKTAYNANKRDLHQALGINLGERFIEFRNLFNPKEKIEEFKKKGITVLTREDRRFPRQLKEIPDAPICLYTKGNLKAFNFEKDFFISVVGTRKPTSYGQHITRKLVAELSWAGFVIVSGMAMGIDTVAHQTALGHKGKTIAVLGCGVDIVYPTINKKLYEEIVDHGGIVVSEFPPGMTTLPGLFIARNRLISGFSRGVLVIEGAKDSGALVTAKYAAEQGREVFAPPAPITSEMSEAPNILLKNGAKLVTTVEDILEEMHMKIIPTKQREIDNNLDGEERNIILLLQREPQLSDELVDQTKTPVNLVLRTLSQLELKGIIEKNNEGKYQLR